MLRSTSELRPDQQCPGAGVQGKDNFCENKGSWYLTEQEKHLPTKNREGWQVPSTLTCTLKVHLCHQCPERSSGKQPAGPSDRRLVGQQVNGGKAFLPCCEVCDVEGESVPLAVLQRPLPQDQVHSCIASGCSSFVQHEGLVFKAVRCPSLRR